jgi:streptomycin 6-kinase
VIHREAPVFDIPENLRWMTADDSPANAWIAVLPTVVADLAERWSLTVGDPFRPGGTTSWVAPAVGPDGDESVLKVGWLHYEARDEAEGLRAWAGDGVVRLSQADQFGQTTALLLETCRPGTTLTEALWRGLPATATRNVLLCTDLHPDNVLAAQREPWLVIDPKPYVGDPAYEPIQHMLNFPDRLIAAPGAFADRMAGLLDLDAARVRQYLFARCVLDTRESPELWSVVRDLAP